jgi:choline-glycine betaine transporter
MARRTLDQILTQSWWGKFLLGLFNLFLVYCVWGRYNSLKPGESFEVFAWAPLLWLYKVFGIWGLLLPWGAIGIALTYWGLSQLVRHLSRRPTPEIEGTSGNVEQVENDGSRDDSPPSLAP